MKGSPPKRGNFNASSVTRRAGIIARQIDLAGRGFVAADLCGPLDGSVGLPTPQYPPGPTPPPDLVLPEPDLDFGEPLELFEAVTGALTDRVHPAVPVPWWIFLIGAAAVTVPTIRKIRR